MRGPSLVPAVGQRGLHSARTREWFEVLGQSSVDDTNERIGQVQASRREAASADYACRAIFRSRSVSLPRTDSTWTRKYTSTPTL